MLHCRIGRRNITNCTALPVSELVAFVWQLHEATLAPLLAVLATRLEGETQRAALAYIHKELMLHSRRVYLKELVNEAVNYYLQHAPPPKANRRGAAPCY